VYDRPARFSKPGRSLYLLGRSIRQLWIEKTPELLRVTFEKTQALIQKKLPVFQENLQKDLAALETKYRKKTTQKQAGSESLKN